ncbi:RNA recognition motif domain containing protein [Babesia bovis T2Bo]|uniref:Single stranded G-strand telomeric DNA-binding protein, putative n=1 Tax=Babesia bovis TaxID=5865 RepID=A7AR60_BABBO|nr:RNA recognition motif domain containing protein [Babesia bovis T2Bo]EDO07029.1 RNA recognition motif domain containing protein [Babesia bovis T2Bo]BAN64381.1 single stranded G-strand telomeric DNA-binding protein, putative [Babesia bovis]|eukprot:XP_001610597.1 single stranded G-strand telomeric DNA-binding protein [Babesia bovis T2Bo]
MSQDSKCRVYVGNLSWRVKWQDLKDHMKQVGEVIRADIIEDFDGKSKGCGIVEFVDEITAQRAMDELNDTMLFDRPIFVREDRENAYNFRNTRRQNMNRDWPPYRSIRGPAGDMGGICIVVTNLQWRTSWQDLKDLFKTCAPINRVDILTREDGKSRGVAKVYVQCEEDANALISTYDGYVLDGREICVKYDERGT